MSAQVPDILGMTREGVALKDQLKTSDVNRRAAEENIKSSEENRVIKSRALGALDLQSIPTVEGKLDYLRNREQQLLSENKDPSDTVHIRQLYETGRVEEANQLIDMAVNRGEQLGILNPNGQEKFSATTVNLPGGLTIQTTNSGRKIVSDANGNILEGEAATQAIEQAEMLEIQHREKLADVDIAEARDKKINELSLTRDSDFISEISTRNRNSARDSRRISEALKLSEQAAGGYSAAVKSKLSKLVPGVDVSDEAALDTALTQIALDQLQQFKGPTTDFEFNVTRDVSSRITDTKLARKAKLKSLERAAWFNQREYDQFIKHQRAGGHSDNFSFNFGEEIQTKRGVFTLEDLQDTAVANHMSIDEVLAELNKGE